jgi:competence protein ComEC
MLHKKYWIVLGLIALAIIFIIASFSFWNYQLDKLQVAFMDVGQGDAILVRTPEGLKALIDGGPDQSVLTQLSRILPWWDHRIDLMILSHAHADHYAGLEAVIKRYQVRQIIVSGQALALPKEFWDLAESRQIDIKLVMSGQDINLGSAHLEVLWPDDQPNQDVNDTSLVVKLNYGQRQFWLAGDSGLLVEATLIKQNRTDDIDVLKVSHHGSDTANSEEFLNLLQPEYAVISVAKANSLGLPNQRVLRRLQRLKAELLRTDELGTIIFESDGQSLSYHLKK